MEDSAQVDISLMLRVRDGDEAAFAFLVERHKRRVYQLAYRFLGNAADADDAAQESFVRVYRARVEWEPAARFSTWMYVIVRNVCFRMLERRKPAVSLDEKIRVGDETLERQVADPHTSNPREDLLKREEADLLRQAVEELPSQQRMAVLLSRYEGQSYVEIGQVLGCSPKAVKSLLHRARLTLAERLAKYRNIK